MRTTKKMKQFKVNVIQKIVQPVIVTAEDEDEALELAEEQMRYRFEIYANNTCGFDSPWETWEDEDDTYKVEMTDDIDEWDSMEFELDEYAEVEDVELTFDDGEEDEDEEDEDEDEADN